MAELSVREAYRIWAPDYTAETAISQLEDDLVGAMTPSLAGKRLLDAGCGTGRRMRDCGAARAVGVDFCAEMLAAGQSDGPLAQGHMLLDGDVLDLPLPDRAFDFVWCRLVLGHVRELDRAYAELARAADLGARVIVSDFHPKACQAGHRRSFRCGGEVIEVEHRVHSLDDHARAAHAAGLHRLEVREARIGAGVRHFYEHAGRLEQYDEQAGLPVVLAIAFGKAD